MTVAADCPDITDAINDQIELISETNETPYEFWGGTGCERYQSLTLKRSVVNVDTDPDDFLPVVVRFDASTGDLWSPAVATLIGFKNGVATYEVALD